MEERQQEHDAHVRTIALLAEVAAGSVRPDQLQVDVAAKTWNVQPAADQSAARQEEQTAGS
jgi:hypothetical protein